MAIRNPWSQLRIANTSLLTTDDPDCTDRLLLIRRLYRQEYDSFEIYCRQRWQYGRHDVNRLAGAAQVFSYLVTKSLQIKPEHETQIRPLIGLAPVEAEPCLTQKVEAAPRLLQC